MAAPVRSCVVRGGLCAALLAGRVLGVAPLRVRRVQGRAIRVSASRACQLYCCALTIASTSAVVIGVAYATYAVWSYDCDFVRRSLVWTLLGAVDMLLTIAVVIAHAGGGARRMARLIAYVGEMDRLSTGAGAYSAVAVGGALVYAVVAWTTCLAVFSHVYYSVLVFKTDHDKSTVLSYVFVYLQMVTKTTVMLERAALLHTLSAYLRGVLGRLDALGADLRAHERDDAWYAAALATVQDVKQSYLRLQRLAVQLYRREGIALLLLLIGSTFRMSLCVYIGTSIYYSNESLTRKVLLNLFMWLSWLLLELTKVVALVEPCHVARTAVTTGRAAAGVALSLVRRGRLRDELAGFLEIFELCDIIPTPLGVCVMSRSLLAAVAGVCSTFFVVTRQFNLREYQYV